jgi:lysophospholipase L1-like esterase
MSRTGLGQKLTIGGALLLAVCFAPVHAQSQNTALVPAPFAEGRHAEFLERARQGDIDCLLMGDSITDWWRRAGLAVYEENFGSLNCANFGIAADRTQGVLWRFANGELDGYTPRLMMLMIGTNNLRFRGPPNTPEEVSMGIAAIVTRFRAKFPEAKVLLLGVFPRGAEPGAPLREPIRRINSIIAGLDDGEYVRFMDIGDQFLEPDGSISTDVMADGLHPTELGYEIWADAVMPTFTEMLASGRK